MTTTTKCKPRRATPNRSAGAGPWYALACDEHGIVTQGRDRAGAERLHDEIVADPACLAKAAASSPRDVNGRLL